MNIHIYHLKNFTFSEQAGLTVTSTQVVKPVEQPLYTSGSGTLLVFICCSEQFTRNLKYFLTTSNLIILPKLLPICYKALTRLTKYDVIFITKPYVVDDRWYRI